MIYILAVSNSFLRFHIYFQCILKSEWKQLDEIMIIIISKHQQISMSAEQLQTNQNNNKTRKHTYTNFGDILKETYIIALRKKMKLSVTDFFSKCGQILTEFDHIY